MILSPSQEIAKTKISKFLKSSDKMFILEGSAGTGKSTIITYILNQEEYQNKLVSFSATTNKAVSVLKKYSVNSKNYFYCTIHKLLNIKRQINNVGNELFVTGAELVENNSKTLSIYNYDIIVIDESSMISKDLLKKIVKIIDKIKGKIIFLGDPAQLPPVNETKCIIFHTNDIPKFRLTEIMRYTGTIVGLCNSIREIVFDPNFKIKFSDFKSDNIKMFKDFDKSIKKYLKFFDGGFRPIYLVYTNKKCDLINSIVRSEIFNGTKKRFEEGEIILFDNYYCSATKENYYTSQSMIVKKISEDTIYLNNLDINSIFNIIKFIGCSLCFNKVYRKNVCGCNLCNECINKWINKKLICPNCLVKCGDNKIIEIKDDEKLSHNINELIKLLDSKKFKIYKLKLDNSDIVDTIHEDSLEEYEYFLGNIREKLKDINNYIDIHYKGTNQGTNKGTIFDNIMTQLWQTIYEEYIDVFADISYGYSITTHKSQGSNYKVVFVDLENIINFNQNKEESYRCLYTAVTRTSKYLNILI